jgi:hypothetical protein
MWMGFWQGVGVEMTFLVLFLVWLLLYQNHGHRFQDNHLIHKLHDYFTK